MVQGICGARHQARELIARLRRRNDDLADVLGSQYGVRSIVKRTKPVQSIPAPESVIQELTGQCDLVITGSGD